AEAGTHTLDEYSAIYSGDEIRPFFKTSINDDPDVTGLTVFLQDAAGYPVGGKVHYVLASYAKSGEGENDEADQGLQIRVRTLDGELPVFVPPEGLEAGSYGLVFQVMGKKNILYRYEQPLVYLADFEFALKDINSYLPFVSSGSHLAAPGITILLKADIVCDDGLDPYIQWYSGKKQIGEGRLSKGGDRLLWETPSQTGFHTIRAEVFPYLHNGGLPKNFSGVTKEFALAVSPKAEAGGYFSGTADSCVRWYQFQGNLHDSAALPNDENDLRAITNKAPVWEPAGSIYGLSLDRDHVYEVPGDPFALDNPGGGSGEIRLRLMPLSAGTIFSYDLPLKDSSAPLCLSLMYTDEGLVLYLSAGTQTRYTLIGNDKLTRNGFITPRVHLSLDNNIFSAGLSDEGHFISEDISILLPASVSDAGIFRIGGPVPENLGFMKPESTAEEEGQLETEESTSRENAVCALMDELQIAFTAAPVPAEAADREERIFPAESE
ncbi:hypothetical protein LJC14_06755, partial [Treponema sp. OttesenSCG-928-L16]|nr:hypothetical protein [Treponema sp. OttesenSCG-928-L16]